MTLHKPNLIRIYSSSDDLVQTPNFIQAKRPSIQDFENRLE